MLDELNFCPLSALLSKSIEVSIDLNQAYATIEHAWSTKHTLSSLQKSGRLAKNCYRKGINQSLTDQSKKQRSCLFFKSMHGSLPYLLRIPYYCGVYCTVQNFITLASTAPSFITK